MSNASATEQAHSGEHVHPPGYYVKIWGILCVLLVVSIVGPMLEIRLLTLLTAFGIAIVKAYLVLSYFMHLNIEKKYVTYLLATALTFMVLMYVGVAPDVLKHEGHQWSNDAAKRAVQQGLSAGGVEHGE